MTQVALVHDYLTQPGGAERVVLALARIFPDAPIHTSLYDPDGTFPEFRDLDVRPSRLQGKVDPDRFRRAALRFPGAFAELDLSDADAVIASTSGFAHHVRHPRLLAYCHTPPRFLWRADEYLDSRAKALLARPALEPLRRADLGAARGVHEFAANSHLTASRIEETYGRDARVIHPPLWTDHLPAEPPPPPDEPRALIAARLLPYKRVDVAIRACALADVPLTVVGDGPDEARLRQLAADTGGDADFRGRVDDAAFAELFATHGVVLVPGVEDFGFAPVEANYAGRPVVAIAAGGPLETVTDGVHGTRVTGHDPTDWARAIGTALSRDWDADELRAQATERFGFEVFRDAVLAWVQEAGG